MDQQIKKQYELLTSNLDRTIYLLTISKLSPPTLEAIDKLLVFLDMNDFTKELPNSDRILNEIIGKNKNKDKIICKTLDSNLFSDDYLVEEINKLDDIEDVIRYIFPILKKRPSNNELKK